MFYQIVGTKRLLNENSVPYIYEKKKSLPQLKDILPSHDEFYKHLVDNALKPSNNIR